MWCMSRTSFAFLARERTAIHGLFRKFVGQPFAANIGLRPRRLSAHFRNSLQHPRVATTESPFRATTHGSSFQLREGFPKANLSGLVCTKNHRAARDYWGSHLWQSFIRSRQTSRQKWAVLSCRSAAYTYRDHSRSADAKHRPALASSDAVGLDNATSQSLTDRLTREHRMTPDEARMILNIRPQDNMDIIAQVSLSMPRSSLLFSAAVQYL